MDPTVMPLLRELAERLRTAEKPLYLRAELTDVERATVYIDTSSRDLIAEQRSTEKSLDAILKGSRASLRAVLDGTLHIHNALESNAVEFAGGLRTMPLVEQALAPRHQNGAKGA